MRFVDEHAQGQIGLDDIARAAHVSPRAVQYAFRRHLEITPLEYLRRLRLARARGDLQTAPPGATVSSIAGRWGFHNHGRFAAAYRETYGENPVDTLRRAPSGRQAPAGR